MGSYITSSMRKRRCGLKKRKVKKVKLKKVKQIVKKTLNSDPKLRLRKPKKKRTILGYFFGS
ncbi:MAG: hypothetical protein LBM93_15355 [Oscillospiraceae bacterium]|jgi:hypothetical protein|nr:hypothetical protein [Oscillospiraceae bacterium]